MPQTNLAPKAFVAAEFRGVWRIRQPTGWETYLVSSIALSTENTVEGSSASRLTTTL
jgi:hypothetical protein